MSNKRKTTTTKNKKRKKHWLGNAIRLLSSEKGLFFVGVSISFMAIYILLGMISFFFTGAEDQSKVINKNFFDLLLHRQIIKNWTGVAGAYFAEKLINKYFGITALIIPLFFIRVGFKLMGIKSISLIKSFFLFALALIWGSLLSSIVLTNIFPNSHIIWGGSHGVILEKLLANSIGLIGVVLVLILMLAIFLIIANSDFINDFRNFFSTKEVTNQDEPIYQKLDNERKKWYTLPFSIKNIIRTPKRNSVKSNTETKEVNDKTPHNIQNIALHTKKDPINKAHFDDDFEIVIPKEEQLYHDTQFEDIKNNQKTPYAETLDEIDNSSINDMEEYDPTKDLSTFSFPSSSLLKIYDNGNKGVDMEEQKANKAKIINTLSNYGIAITSIKATVGPTITLYEIVPQAGIRISKIKNLEDDIALSLSALGIRIIAPMPGKGTIGIEVPNKDPQIVSMQSVIASRKFQECNYDLPVALGKTITNEIFMFDLCKMPHLLVAGATGQGKSVGLNAIITSLLYKKHPAEMKMVLVDPKMVEFNIYSTIEKHYLAKLPDADKAIITDVTKVTQTLNSLTKEMDDRYELLMAANVRNIKEYNEKFKKRRLNPNKGHKFLPYIVVIIDEFGDLIMTAGKEIELPIARIAQKARAVGIHMIIATQRPTTNIITGTIKANFPARMAFRVTSQIDSRTILDTSGANQLIGRGDMLFSQGSDIIRIQCAFVDTPEVEEITYYISNQQGYSNAFALPEYVGDATNSDKSVSIDVNDRDSLFEEAARLIVIHQQGSTSLIQRKFSIGYNRAGRLMDQLEAAGIVGPAQGSKPRDVLVLDEYSLEQKLSTH